MGLAAVPEVALPARGRIYLAQLPNPSLTLSAAASSARLRRHRPGDGGERLRLSPRLSRQERRCDSRLAPLPLRILLAGAVLIEKLARLGFCGASLRRKTSFLWRAGARGSDDHKNVKHAGFAPEGNVACCRRGAGASAAGLWSGFVTSRLELKRFGIEEESCPWEAALASGHATRNTPRSPFPRLGSCFRNKHIKQGR